MRTDPVAVKLALYRITAETGRIPAAQAVADELAITSPPHARRDELEAAYGTEVALGVRWDEATQTSLLPGGGEAVRCTDCAREILARERAGRLLGYECGTNPSAGATGDFPGTGHDFALIDGRYIVDPWVREVACTSGRAVFDLLDPHDRDEIRRLYGDPGTWKELDFTRSDHLDGR